MEKTITKTINLCDLCKCESSTKILQTCPRCKREVCYSCSHELYDVFNTYLCRRCNQIPEVNKVFMGLHKKWLKGRENALKAMSFQKKPSNPS